MKTFTHRQSRCTAPISYATGEYVGYCNRWQCVRCGKRRFELEANRYRETAKILSEDGFKAYFVTVGRKVGLGDVKPLKRFLASIKAYLRTIQAENLTGLGISDQHYLHAHIVIMAKGFDIEDFEKRFSAKGTAMEFVKYVEPVNNLEGTITYTCQNVYAMGDELGLWEHKLTASKGMRQPHKAVAFSDAVAVKERESLLVSLCLLDGALGGYGDRIPEFAKVEVSPLDAILTYFDESESHDLFETLAMNGHRLGDILSQLEHELGLSIRDDVMVEVDTLLSRLIDEISRGEQSPLPHRLSSLKAVP